MSLPNGVSSSEGLALTGAALLLCILFVWGFWSWFAPPLGVRLGVALLALGVFCLWPFYFARRRTRLADPDDSTDNQRNRRK